MKLSDWASIAEIASGIAVVVTLVFLVVGINENTNMTRASVYERTLGRLNEIESRIVTDPEINRLYDNYMGSASNPGSLEGADMSLIDSFLVMHFRVYDTAFFSQQYGLMGDSEWSRFERAICQGHARAKLLERLDLLRNLVSDKFWNYMTRACDA